MAQRLAYSLTGKVTITVDTLVSKFDIAFIHLLHSDIQGHELAMLHGAEKTFRSRRVGFVFISTHSDQLHDECRAWLRSHNFSIVAAYTIQESYTSDGLIVAKAESQDGPESLPVSRRVNTA